MGEGGGVLGGLVGGWCCLVLTSTFFGTKKTCLCNTPMLIFVKTVKPSNAFRFNLKGPAKSGLYIFKEFIMMSRLEIVVFGFERF